MKLPFLTTLEDRCEERVRQDSVRRIISTYHGIVKLYSMVRFRIIHIRFLQEIEQYLPEEGTVLDLGCGFGLFALYMAQRRPRLQVVGIDVDSRRIEIARRSAEEMGLRNVTFIEGDLRSWRPTDALTAAYALDVLHHVPQEIADELVEAVFQRLEAGGKFLLKDIDTCPRYMMLFTYLLDMMMAPASPVCYRAASAWVSLMREAGFSDVAVHHLRDLLPYPHLFMIGRKPVDPGGLSP